MAPPSRKKATYEEILRVSVPLFAQHGYDAVSMRDIATAIGVQAPALYYHFPDKQALYLAAMGYAFTDRLIEPLAILNGPDRPQTRLRRFIKELIKDLIGDRDLLLLLQRERLDGDEARWKLLVERLFAPSILALNKLMEELDPEGDTALLAMSISGMVMHHLEVLPTAHLMPGWKPEYADPEYLSNHLCKLAAAIFGTNHDFSE